MNFHCLNPHWASFLYLISKLSSYLLTVLTIEPGPAVGTQTTQTSLWFKGQTTLTNRKDVTVSPGKPSCTLPAFSGQAGAVGCYGVLPGEWVLSV